ncbi:hypothetical protein MBANPS3_011153, partial [Mucor bainieri]
MIDGAVEEANEIRLQRQVPQLASIAVDNVQVLQEVVPVPVINQDPLQDQAGIDAVILVP